MKCGLANVRKNALVFPCLAFVLILSIMHIRKNGHRSENNLSMAVDVVEKINTFNLTDSTADTKSNGYITSFKVDFFINRMRARRRRVMEICQHHNFVGDSLDALRMFRKNRNNLLDKHVLVNDELKLIYCQVPKAGTTNMKRILLTLQKHVKAESINLIDIPPEYAWVYTREISDLLTLPLNDSDIIEMFDRYHKLLIVRHPFERLVSAYRMIFEVGKFETFNYPKQLWAVKMIQTALYGPNKSHRSNISFVEFAKFVCIQHTNKSGKERWKLDRNLDVHWLPQTSLCHPCLTHYTIISKIETIDEDMPYIMHLMGANNAFLYPKQYKRTSNVGRYMALLSSADVGCLRQVYGLDFELFGYNATSYLAFVSENV